MEPEQLINAIRTGALPPILVLHGEEEYLKDYVMNEVRRALVPEGLDDLNVTLLDGRKATAADIDAACRTLPFMAERRLVVVRDFTPLAYSGQPGEEREKTGEDAEEEAEEPGGGAPRDEASRLAGNVPPTACLVFFNRGRINTRGVWFKQLTRTGQSVQCKPLGETDAAGWVVRMAAERGKRLSRSDALFLLRTGDGRLLRAAGELDKLAAYVGDGPCIGREDIEAVCAQTAEYRVFRMIDRLAQGDGRESAAAYRRIVAAGDSPHMVLALASRQLAARMWALELEWPEDEEERKKAVSQAAGLLGVPGFVMENALRQRSHIDRDAMRDAVIWCAQTDEEIKSGACRDETAIELLMMRIAYRLARGENSFQERSGGVGAPRIPG